MSDEDYWVWDSAFHAEDELSYPKIVRDEVKAIADEIVKLANMGVDPNTLGEEMGTGTARRHDLPCGGWFETQALPGRRPRAIFVVLVVPPPHLL
ncbi:hypothetical protein [Streptomyces luteireticuli]|uniref:Uncharacterized protein n=1 Tax=Streptomyces luteireticuli TaxID=173858 RepID=A0ABN0Z622_9ACTN